jgi:chemotaxis protein MotB
MRFATLWWVAPVMAVIAGCGPSQSCRDIEFKLHRAENERQTCAAELRDERARSAAAVEHAERQRRDLDGAWAELNALRARNESLQRQYDELAALIAARAGAPLERPAVPAALLPPPLDEALRAFAEKFEHRAWYDRGSGAVSFANDKLFESGSDDVRADAQAALHELAKLAAQNLPAEYEVVVIGHTDDTPIRQPETLARHPSNWHLSVHRAIAVKDVLVSGGLPADRVGIMGYGQYRPISSDPSRNRRVEVFFVRKGDIQTLRPIKVSG